jgi:hypothetical protein
MLFGKHDLESNSWGGRKESSAMIDKSVSYGEPYQLLAQLHFVDVSSEHRWKAYRQGDTDILILLANRDFDLHARSADVVSVRRHLVDNGVLDQREFERLLS